MNKLEGMLSMLGKSPTITKECFGAETMVIDVPKPNHKLFIAIGQKGEIKEPHIHVFRSGNDMINWIRGVPLSLLRNAYIIHDRQRVGELTKEELEAIRHNMHLQTKTVVNSQRLDITNWRDTFNTWNDYNGDLQRNPQDYTIPSYSSKSIIKGRSYL